MPKIIEGIETKILETAEELFINEYYEKVDMRQIAKKVGIAVGTLYNYYPNKQQLFVEVFKHSWENTFRKLDKIVTSGEYEDSVEKIKVYIQTLYEDIEARRGLGREFFQKERMIRKEKGVCTTQKRSYWEDIREKGLGHIEQMFQELHEEKDIDMDQSTKERLSTTIVFLIFGLSGEYPDEKEKNLQFIYDMIRSLYKQNAVSRH